MGISPFFYLLNFCHEHLCDHQLVDIFCGISYQIASKLLSSRIPGSHPCFLMFFEVKIHLIFFFQQRSHRLDLGKGFFYTFFDQLEACGRVQAPGRISCTLFGSYGHDVFAIFLGMFAYALISGQENRWNSHISRIKSVKRELGHQLAVDLDPAEPLVLGSVSHRAGIHAFRRMISDI